MLQCIAEVIFVVPVCHFSYSVNMFFDNNLIVYDGEKT